VTPGDRAGDCPRPPDSDPSWDEIAIDLAAAVERRGEMSIVELTRAARRVYPRLPVEAIAAAENRGLLTERGGLWRAA